MKRALVYLLVCFFLALLQTSVFPNLLPFNLKPDLFLILIIYLGLTESALRGAFLSYVLGSFANVYVGSSAGLYGFVFLLTFLTVRAIASQVNTESSFLLLFMVFFGTLFHGGLMILSLGFFDDAGSAWLLILRMLGGQAILNLFFAFLLLRLLLGVRKRLAPRWEIPGLQRLDNRYGY